MKTTLLSRLSLMALALLCSTLSFATQYCQETLTSGSNTIQVSCKLMGTDQYQILIEGTGLVGLGGSFAEVNGVGGYYLNGDHCVVSADGTSITVDITSTVAPVIYTPLYVLMPGEVNFGSINNIEWVTCGGGSTDNVAPVLGACALQGTPTFNSATIAVSATDDVTNPVTAFVVNDAANGVVNRTVQAAADVITINGLSKNTLYNLTINAKDQAGNVSANDTTITFTTADRPSDCSGSLGHFGNPTVTKIDYSISYQGGAIMFEVTPIAAGDSITFCEVQTTVGNNVATIAANKAAYPMTGQTAGAEIGVRFLYGLNTMPGMEMTSENVTLNDAQIVYYVVGECSTGVVIPTSPQEAAPSPAIYPAGKAIAIFSDVNGQLANTDFNPNWGQPTQVSFELIDGNNTMVYTSFTYQGIALAGDINANSMDSIHIDVWSETALAPRLFPICRTMTNGEQSYTLNLVPGQWNSFNIPVSYFTNLGLDMSGIFQFKMDDGNNAKIYIDNLYLFSTSVDQDTIAPANLTAVAGAITYNSIELILNATDSSGVISYHILYDTLEVTTSGNSAEVKSYVVNGLEESTAYSFAVVALDLTGNASDTVTVTATTTAGPARPTVAAPVPTISAEDVISIYSDSYTPACEWALGSWGQSTVTSLYSVEENEMMKLENFNYLGLELNGNEAAFDASEMTHLHIDVWTPNATQFQITPIWGGEALYTCTPLATETWNSYDIPLTAFAGINLENIYQIKVVGNNTAYLDNIYFYKQQESAVVTPTTDAVVFAKNGVLYINGLNQERVAIYTANGQCVYMATEAANQLSIELQKGVYLVTIGTKTVKVVL